MISSLILTLVMILRSPSLIAVPYFLSRPEYFW